MPVLSIFLLKNIAFRSIKLKVEFLRHFPIVGIIGCYLPNMKNTGMVFILSLKILLALVFIGV
ncbi:MAG: hypothetical protein CFE21_02550 [Bacteroidetes bacterium B1(2017)]|nr:MAG: hypothetical protein CFE21_02550 [Bacteroidetes bacterium B1(2017)]